MIDLIWEEPALPNHLRSVAGLRHGHFAKSTMLSDSMMRPTMTACTVHSTTPPRDEMGRPVIERPTPGLKIKCLSSTPTPGLQRLGSPGRERESKSAVPRRNRTGVATGSQSRLCRGCSGRVRTRLWDRRAGDRRSPPQTEHRGWWVARSATASNEIQGRSVSWAGREKLI